VCYSVHRRRWRVSSVAGGAGGAVCYSVFWKLWRVGSVCGEELEVLEAGGDALCATMYVRGRGRRDLIAGGAGGNTLCATLNTGGRGG